MSSQLAGLMDHKPPPHSLSKLQRLVTDCRWREEPPAAGGGAADALTHSQVSVRPSNTDIVLSRPRRKEHEVNAHFSRAVSVTIQHCLDRTFTITLVGRRRKT
uniref:Uncharacterized protein n=1 Tax=Nothobranchius rachovii TaxID=451742 RepID=A0A1A8NRN6_9TELE